VSSLKALAANRPPQRKLKREKYGIPLPRVSKLATMVLLHGMAKKSRHLKAFVLLQASLGCPFLDDESNYTHVN